MYYHCIYLSRSTIPLESLESELNNIKRSSSTNNLRDKIAGALLYRDGHFLQYLEGEKTLLEQTMDRIINDSRHEQLEILRKSYIAEPMFTDWSQMRVFSSPQETQMILNFISDIKEMEDKDEYINRIGSTALVDLFRNFVV